MEREDGSIYGVEIRVWVFINKHNYRGDRMKTFWQWWISLGIGRPEDTEVYDSEYDGYFRAEQAWSACDAGWRAFIEKEQSVKSFEEFLKMNDREQHYSSFEGAAALTAWDFQDKQWRHVVANKEQALRLKSEAFDLLKKKNEELERDLKWITAKSLHYSLTGLTIDRVFDSQIKEIRQRHKLDEETK